jgi:ribosomal protein L1
VLRRYMQVGILSGGFLPPPKEKTMRAEVERLVEEIKQSVGLLRRHL